jgi:hypothetical protein
MLLSWRVPFLQLVTVFSGELALAAEGNGAGWVPSLADKEREMQWSALTGVPEEAGGPC